jgi:hypothetical protein
MEPISAMLATGAVAVFIQSMRRNLPVEISTLPGVLENPDIGDLSLTEVVAVHLHNVELAPRYAGRGLLAQVRYGSRDTSVRCNSSQVVVAEVTKQTGSELKCSAELKQTSIFLRHRHLVPRIHIHLRTPHLGRTFGIAHYTMISGERSTRQIDLPIWGTCMHSHELIGKIWISMESRVVRKGSLQDILNLFDAQHSKQGVLVGPTPVVEGSIVAAAGAANGEQASETTEPPIHFGAPIARNSFYTTEYS